MLRRTLGGERPKKSGRPASEAARFSMPEGKPGFHAAHSICADCFVKHSVKYTPMEAGCTLPNAYVASIIYSLFIVHYSLFIVEVPP